MTVHQLLDSEFRIEKEQYDSMLTDIHNNETLDINTGIHEDNNSEQAYQSTLQYVFGLFHLRVGFDNTNTIVALEPGVEFNLFSGAKSPSSRSNAGSAATE